MAAFIFAVGGKKDSIDVVESLVKNGVYSTVVKDVKNSLPFEATLVDYMTMREGDDVYFFSKRKIYGIGSLIKVGNDCKYCNFINAGSPDFYPKYEAIRESLLVDFGRDSANNRWVCIFKPNPCFFRQGLDMDDVLRYKPDCFKMLRAFWKRSFIKLGDDEARALREVFLIRNQHAIGSASDCFAFSALVHRKFLKADSRFLISADEIVSAALGHRGVVKHEMAVEAAVVNDLVAGRNVDVFGEWDFVTHQVVASPLKPVDYMDRIDVLAIRYIKEVQEKIPCKYLVAEIKNECVKADVLVQLMEYVDWTCSEYTYGDYGRIEALVVAPKFEKGVYEELADFCKRKYLIGSHPAKPKEWCDIKLVAYEVNMATKKLTFKRANSTVWSP